MKNKWACVFLLLLPCFAVTEVLIVENGSPRAQIVLADGAPRMARFAANELQGYIEKISGAVLPIVTTSSADVNALPIYVGKSEWTEQRGYGDEGLAHGAYRMVIDDDYVLLLGRDRDFTPLPPQSQEEWDEITGEYWLYPYRQFSRYQNRDLGLWLQDERGSLNAVYALLRELGVRWYLPGERGEVVPEANSIAVERLDRTVHPDFAYRYMGRPVNTDDFLWQMRLGLNMAADIVGIQMQSSLLQGTMNVLNRDEARKAHPEWYPLIDGKRFTDQRGFPCLSSEPFFENHLKYVRFLYDHYDDPMVSLMPGAGEGILCECEGCKDQGSPELGWEGETSNFVWGYVDRVAREAYTTHPERKVSCVAYNRFVEAPTVVDAFSPNVVVCIRQWRARFHPDNDEGAFSRARQEGIREGWLSKLAAGPSLVLWESSMSSMSVPILFPHLIAEDLRQLKGHSLGEWIEVARQRDGVTGIAVNHLNLYVMARLLWDVDLDVDELLNEYFVLYFGPASREMADLFHFVEQSYTRMPQDSTLIKEFLTRLGAAQSLAPPDSVYAWRINLIAAAYTELLNSRLQELAMEAEVPEARGAAIGNVAVEMDGILDEAVWQDAPEFSLFDRKTGQASEALNSTFRMFWDADSSSLFVGIECRDPDTSSLNVRAEEDGDPRVFDGDAVEVLLATGHHSYYQIAISPNGAMMDIDRAVRNTRWMSRAEIATHIGEEGWSVEMRIPVLNPEDGDADSSIGVVGNRPTAADPWRINIGRQRIRDDAVDVLAFSHSGRFHNPSLFGRFWIEKP